VPHTSAPRTSAAPSAIRAAKSLPTTRGRMALGKRPSTLATSLGLMPEASTFTSTSPDLIAGTGMSLTPIRRAAMFLDVECFHGHRLRCGTNKSANRKKTILLLLRPPSKRSRVGIGTIWNPGILGLNARAWQAERCKSWRLPDARFWLAISQEAVI